MSQQISIQIEAAKQISPHEELGIIRAAFARNPSGLMRERLVGLLSLADAFDEIVQLLSNASDLSFWEAIMLAQACFARESRSDDECARAAAERALRGAGTNAEMATALATRAKAEIRLGDTSAARATLRDALKLDPRNIDACKRSVALELAAGNIEELLELLDELAAAGAAHSRLFVGRALAHARAGDVAAAARDIGFDAFARVDELTAPAGWSSTESFNAALAEELLAHPGLRYERYGTASELTWRIDAPATGDAHCVRLLLDQLSSRIRAHLDSIAPVDHPWVNARPKDALLRSWCVITDSDGYETWHVHHFGWLSGVYYVQVPDSIATGTGEEGCLAFGLPPDLAGASAAEAFGIELVRPRAGMMMAFPSHAYHRTFPHATGEKRICVAFDLRPL